MIDKAAHLQQGQTAETQALAFLQQQGLQLVQQNFRSKQGEIDLIMLDSDCLVFVEVRFRQLQTDALLSITPSKQRKIIQTARHYLSQSRDLPPCRFDVVALATHESPLWIKAAFDVGS